MIKHQLKWYQWGATGTAMTCLEPPSLAWRRWIHTVSNTRSNATVRVRAVDDEYFLPISNQPVLTGEEALAEPARGPRVEPVIVTPAEAHAKAEALLIEHLDPVQRQQYTADRSFVVVGASGRRYRIRPGWVGNVDELDANDVAVARLCIHPMVVLPHPDHQLAQKLMLETDEALFRLTANVTPARYVATPGMYVC